jgi:zinc D-Ala-D-Ala carboxypeptidase
MMLSEHFSLQELCKSETALRKGINNSPHKEEVVENLTFLCSEILEPIRENFGVPFSPQSGYRCPVLNKILGSSDRSQHVKGEAADIEIPTVDNSDLAIWISKNLIFDQLILECYTPGESTSGWVHISRTDDENRAECLTYDGKNYHNGLIV